MAYNIEKNNGNITINDGELNLETSLQLVGRDYFGYGEAIAQNLVDLLENFASAGHAQTDFGPNNPTVGQIWYNKGQSGFMYWDGSNWLSLTAGIKALTVKDAENTPHTITVLYETDNLGVEHTIAAISAETIEKGLHADEPLYDKFVGHKIYKGITLAQGMLLHGTATSAQYADLAELYQSDQEYEAGTVLKIGGEAEVTQTTDALCMEVFGVVSSNPAYLMNSAAEGTTVPVALEGRVPVRVIGEVKKGQRLVASETPGVARGVTKFEHAEGDDWFRMVGRALEDKTTLGEGLVEAVVGAK